MAVTFTGNDGVIFTFNDEEIDDIAVDLVSNPDQYGQYGGGPADAYIYESEGPLCTINISGRLLVASTTRTSSGSTTTIDQQRQWLMKQFNGAQVPRAFSSDFAGTMYSGTTDTFVPTTVIAGRFSYRQQGEPDVLPFTISLLVGGQ